MKNLITRTLTAAVFCFVVIYCMMAGPWQSAALFGVFGMIGLHEFYKLVKSSKAASPLVPLGLVVGALVYVLLIRYHILQTDAVELSWIIVPLVIGSVVWLLSKKQATMTNLAFTWIGPMYAVFPFVFMVALGFHEGGYDYIIPLGVILLTWANDTGAYLVGSAIGKNKLIERLSPGKTWEGLIGALILTLISAYIIENYMFGAINGSWYIIAVICSVFSTLGDLFESRMKRLAGVKDSGTLMPGHGGVLDRFDGLLFVLPMVYWYLSVWH